jgi:short coiled-coil protein
MSQTPDHEQVPSPAVVAANVNHIESDPDSLSTHSRTSYDLNYNSEEEEEKQRLINQVLTLQKTLDDLSHRVDTVKEENFKLRSENQVLGQYIENLMAASNVFQMTNK